MPRNACLEVHQINVGQGDAVLIVNRHLGNLDIAIRAAIAAAAQTPKPLPQQPVDPIDWMPYAVANGVPLAGTVKRALLVDGGDDEYGGDVAGYLEAHGVFTPGTVWTQNLALVVSHYHDDHMAGLRSVFKEKVEDDNGKAHINDRYRPGSVYQSSVTTKSKPKSERFRLFQEDVRKAVNRRTDKTELFTIDIGGRDSAGEPMKISLGQGIDNIPIDVHIVASGQGVYDPARKNVTSIASRGKTVDQNDRSVVLMLQYGSFRYFMGGDIAGNGGPAGGNTGGNAADTKKKKFFSQHADVEGVLGPALERRFPASTQWTPGAPKFVNAGYCTVMKADHHGSSSSVDVYLLATLRPCVVLISSGVRSRFHRHPTQQVIDRTTAAQTGRWQPRPVNGTSPGTVANKIQRVYVTEAAKKVKGTAFSMDLRGAPIMGDIVVRPIDETVRAVQNANARGAQLTVQVYGSGTRSEIADLRTELRETAAVNPQPHTYPIGPYEHSDTH
jgi:beta-lactamase superfamily II metal-dependent hydrolase